MRPSMRPTGQQPADKGKGITQPDTYAQTLLGRQNFRPLSTIDNLMERIYFGKYNLISYPKCNLSFRVISDCNLEKAQQCLLDNLWIAYNKQNTKYFIADSNVLCQYFSNKNRDNKFKYYVVIHDKNKGVFQIWIEVVDSINGVKNPLFKGFNNFTEALDYARGILRPNYYISPALRQSPNQIPQYNILKDSDKIIFCNHCSSMTEGFKRLNAKNEILIQENMRLMKQLETFQNKYVPRTDSTKDMSSPSPLKMDEMGVHSPLNAKNSTVSEYDTASPVQMVIGKGLSNPLMTVTLPKSEEEESSSSRRRLPKYFHKDSLRKNEALKKKKNEKLE
ncbi:hypothetical protein AABB24_021833 [Solanum stoloniferum]|uniref:Ribonuclease H1 N-terminal domain-containing protein n=1 Tax=Solanum stoloniferum TaxID=62892 RepID=A0ABD2SWR0_9SOLN